MTIKRRLKLWAGVFAVITAIVAIWFACVMKTQDVEFNEIYVNSFISSLSVEIQKINVVIARYLNRSGTGITASDDTIANPASDGSPAYESITRGIPQKIGLKKLLYFGTVSLKMLVRVCLKRLRHTM